MYYQDRFFDDHFKFSFFLPGKWISGDGQSLWMAWSGYPDDNVSFIRGAVRLRDRGRKP